MDISVERNVRSLESTLRRWVYIVGDEHVYVEPFSLHTLLYAAVHCAYYLYPDKLTDFLVVKHGGTLLWA